MLVEWKKVASDNNICESETLTDEEGLVEEMIVQNLEQQKTKNSWDQFMDCDK